MKSLARVSLVLATASVLPACATVVRGTKTTYRVASTPDGADVAFSTGQTCVTPCTMKLKRKEGFTATVTKPGYWTETATVRSKFSGGGGVVATGNALLGGIIGGVVDGSNGSLNSFFPRSLDLTLKPRPEESPLARVVKSSPGFPTHIAVVPSGETGAGVAKPARTISSALDRRLVEARASSDLTPMERFEHALKAAQPIKNGDPKQGWTVTD